MDMTLMILAGLAILLCILLFFMLIRTNAKLGSLEKKYKRFMRGSDGISLAESFQDEFEKIDKLEDNQKMLRASINALQNEQRMNYSKYGIVKYDAFEDVGGRLSFALALLNDMDSGIVLNAIHSKDNCFLYLKEIVNGESYIMLSNEEIKALQAAKATTAPEELIFDVGDPIITKEDSRITAEIPTDEVESRLERAFRESGKANVSSSAGRKTSSFRANTGHRLHDMDMEKSLEELRDIERENVADELMDMNIEYEDYEGVDDYDDFTDANTFNDDVLNDVFGE